MKKDIEGAGWIKDGRIRGKTEIERNKKLIHSILNPISFITKPQI